MDDKARASAAFRQKALAERFARLRDAVANGIAPPPFHTVVAEDRDMMIRPVELRAEQIGAADIPPEPILRAALAATGGTALPPRGDIVRIMRRAAPGGMEGESTFTRRASTVRGWTSWLLDMCGTLPGTFRAF